MEILKVKRLRLGFSHHEVIREASFEVSEGDFVTVVGANGSGKSTLIKAILGLIKPISGSIEFLNGYTARDIGYLPQEMHSRSAFPATVSEVVLTGMLPKMRMRICYAEAEERRMEEVLGKLGISELQRESFEELSGGQKQKVLLARALISSPKLLFLDEPSNNLDQGSEKVFYELLKDLNKHGMTILMITHDIDAEDLIGSKVLSIEDGKTRMQKTAEYLRRYRHV